MRTTRSRGAVLITAALTKFEPPEIGFSYSRGIVSIHSKSVSDFEAPPDE